MNANNYLDTLLHLSNSMGETITLNQALKIADRMEEETEKALEGVIPESGYDLGPAWDKIIKEVVGR